MTVLFDRLSDFQLNNALALKALIDKMQVQIEEQFDAVFAIIDPNTLTPDKKPIWMFIDSYLTSEQSDLDAKATTYGITTEKTNYDNAVSALTTYLATLTTPVAWNDTSGNTTIVDATFRGKFSDVLTTKQALINTMQAQAKVLADAAQTQANTATTTANTAKLNDKISASATAPSSVLTGHDAGSNASIIIANHTRLYGDNTTLSVTGATLTGLTYSTLYGVYYDDTTTANTAPTYHATTTLKDAMANAAAGRHYMGQVTTPAAAGGNSGGGITPPGGGGPYP